MSARPRPVIALVAAMDENRLIGAAGRLPWRLPADLRWFRKVTTGKPVVMGRRTYESIGKPLRARRNIVISSNAGYEAPGCETAVGLDEALALAEDVDEVMIIGGATVYAAALPRATRIYLTRLHAAFDGDTWFPEFATEAWRETLREDHEAEHEAPCAYSIIVLER